VRRLMLAQGEALGSENKSPRGRPPPQRQPSPFLVSRFDPAAQTLPPKASLAPEPGFSYGLLRNRGLYVAQQTCCQEVRESKFLLALENIPQGVSIFTRCRTPKRYHIALA
jgi:hypothetical protein